MLPLLGLGVVGFICVGIVVFEKLPKTLLFHSLPQVAKETPQEQNENLKKDFEQFYAAANEADKNNDAAVLCKTIHPADQKYLSYENCTYQVTKRKKPFSINYQIHDVVVSSNSAQINRTIITCLTQTCDGTNRLEETGMKEFVRIGNQWFQPTRLAQVSEKALSLAASDYVNHPEDHALIKKSFDLLPETDDVTAIHFVAHMLDSDPERMAVFEAYAKKDQADNNRPVVNYQAPAVQPVNNQPESSTSHRGINCVSSQIGSSSYTNCY